MRTFAHAEPFAGPTNTAESEIDCAHRCGRTVSVLSCDDHRHCRHGTVCLPCWREIEQASTQEPQRRRK